MNELSTAANLPGPAAVYSIYIELMRHAHRAAPHAQPNGASTDPEPDLGGQLVLYDVLDEAGAATAIAANMAGAASLGIDPDPERLKQAIRNGVCDFVVNSLDEALRILKNEIRKKQPVAVGLNGEVAAALAAIVERGVQPDLLAFADRAFADGGVDNGGPIDASVAELVRRGAQSLVDDTPDSLPLFLESVRWSVADSPARWLPRLDNLAADALTSTGTAIAGVPQKARLRWLRLSNRYFPRAAYHCLKMSDSEAQQFMAEISVHTAAGEIATTVTIERENILNSRLVETFQPR